MEEKGKYEVDNAMPEPGQLVTARLQDEVDNLVAVRNWLQETKAELALANAALYELPEYLKVVKLETEIAEIKEKERKEMDLVRQIAVADYEDHHSKTPAPGISIRMTKALEYDKAEARDWVKDHLPNALILDATLFEKHAQAVAETAPIPFVVIHETPTATIATKLPGQD